MRLGLARTIKLTLASFFIQTSWSFHSLQNLGYLFVLLHGAQKDQHEKLKNKYSADFNTHPYMASYIIGAILRIHEDKKILDHNIDRFITVAQTSFASTGDLLFWQTIRPALLLAAVILGIKIGIAGPIAAFVIYNILHLYHRIQGFQDGYNRGPDIIYVLRTKRFTSVLQIFEILGALLTGGLIALVTFDFNALLIIPLCLIFTGLLFKHIASAIIVIIAIIATMVIVLV